MIPSNVLRSGEVLLISLIRPQSSVALLVRFAFCRSQLDNFHFLMRFQRPEAVSTICTEQLERRALCVRVACQEKEHLHNFSVLAAFVSSSRGV